MCVFCERLGDIETKTEYRPSCAAVLGNRISIGIGSGKVSMREGR
jgi:hypothetical protein